MIITRFNFKIVSLNVVKSKSLHLKVICHSFEVECEKIGHK